MSRRLGRGLDALIHAVEPIEIEPDKPNEPVPGPSPALPWPVEHPDALSSPSARSQARSRLSEPSDLTIYPRHGVIAALAYLDKLRAERGRPSPDHDIDAIDLTHASMLQLKDGKLVRSEHQELTKWKTK